MATGSLGSCCMWYQLVLEGHRAVLMALVPGTQDRGFLSTAVHPQPQLQPQPGLLGLPSCKASSALMGGRLLWGEGPMPLWSSPATFSQLQHPLWVTATSFVSCLVAL